MSYSIISVGKDGFTEIIKLERYDEKVIELYKKISVNKEGMIFVFDGRLTDFLVENNNVMVLNLKDLIEMYGSNISENDIDYEEYLELSVHVLENYNKNDSGIGYAS